MTVAASAFGGLGRVGAEAAGRRSTTAVRASNGARGGAGLNDPRRARDLVRARVISDPPEGKVGGARRRRARDGAKEARDGADGRMTTLGNAVAEESLATSVVKDDATSEMSWTHYRTHPTRGAAANAYRHAIFMTPDDGFIMGAQKTLYHLHRCPCPTCNVFRCRVRNGVDHEGNPVTVLKISEGEFETLKEVGSFKDMTKVEQLRRKRIGSANAGKVPWNKGGKHSKETIEKIRATTLKHMQDPKYRERLKQSYNGSNARHSAFTRTKIKRASVERARVKKIEKSTDESVRVWGPKRGRNGAASSGMFARRNSAVMTVYFGVNGAADIARLRKRQKEEEKVRQKEQRELKKKTVSKLVAKRRAMSKRKPKKPQKRSSEHRKKISQAIANKWRDPEYVAKMRSPRKSPAKRPAQRRQAKRSSIDPAKKKLLDDITAMYKKADAAVKILRERVDNGVAVDQAVLAQATQTRKQTRAMLETVQRSIDKESASSSSSSSSSSTAARARPR